MNWKTTDLFRTYHICQKSWRNFSWTTCFVSVNTQSTQHCSASVNTQCLASVNTQCLASVNTQCLASVNTQCLASVNTQCLASVNNVSHLSTHNVSHLSTHNLRSIHQTAHRSGHNTETVLRMLNDILTMIDDDKIFPLVLLYLSAAFDTINHQIPLSPPAWFLHSLCSPKLVSVLPFCVKNCQKHL